MSAIASMADTGAGSAANAGAADEKRVFNMQLLIQKLEEELSLYRNGTTGAELFEIITEKTAEINDLKKALLTKTENLQKLAKSSADMMAQYTSLQSSFKALSNSHDSLALTHKSTLTALDALQAEHSILVTKSAGQDSDLRAQALTITKLQSELSDAQSTVEKLHARCASLVAEKTCAIKHLDNERFERAEREKELQSELQAIRQTCFDFKKEFDSEAHEKLRVSRQLADSKGVINDIKSAIDVAHRMRVQSELELKRCRDEYEKSIALLTESNLQMKLEHDKVVQQMTVDVEHLTAALESQSLAHSAEMQRREDHWSNEYQKLQRLSETSVLRLQRLEADKEMSQLSRRDSDILRIKNQELEEKIRRLEQQSKSRMLRDKTNTIQCPEMTLGSDATPLVSKPSIAPPTATHTSTGAPKSTHPMSGSSAKPTHAAVSTTSACTLPPPAVPAPMPISSTYKPMPSTSRFANSSNSSSGGGGGLHQPGCATAPINHR